MFPTYRLTFFLWLVAAFTFAGLFLFIGDPDYMLVALVAYIASTIDDIHHKLFND